MTIQVPTQSGQTFTVEVPIHMEINKKGERKPLNLNTYRNLHHYSLSYQKKAFHEAMKPLLRGIPKLGKIWLHYEVYPNRNGTLDTMNPGSVVDKYFSDALVECGIIEDDDHSIVNFNSFSFGAVHKPNAYCKVTIVEIEPKDKPMRVMLDQSDIQTVLEAYVEEQGIAGASGVTITATEDGIEAEVMFGDAQPAEKPKARKKPGPKLKPKVTADDTTTDKGGSDSGDAGPAESGTSEGDDVTTEAPTEETTSKNLFGESPEESSSNDSPQESTDDAAPKPKSKSIFDS